MGEARCFVGKGRVRVYKGVIPRAAQHAVVRRRRGTHGAAPWVPDLRSSIGMLQRVRDDTEVALKIIRLRTYMNFMGERNS